MEGEIKENRNPGGQMLDGVFGCLTYLLFFTKLASSQGIKTNSLHIKISALYLFHFLQRKNQKKK
jgi:hypothetical protein